MTSDAVQFREKVDYAAGVRREMYNARQSDPKYLEIQEYFTEPMTPEKRSGMNPLDVARHEYNQIMYAGDMVDRFHNYNFEEAERRERLFIAQYGQGALDYIEAFRGAKWDEPLPLRLLKDTRKALEPYWQIADEVWSNFPPEAKQVSKEFDIRNRADERDAKAFLWQSQMGPQVLAARRWIAIMQNQWKLQNPDAARMLRVFYSF